MEKKRVFKVLSVLFFNFLILISFLGGCQEPIGKSKVQKIVIGIQPNEKEKDLEQFKKELGARTQLEVETDISKDYSALIEKFKDGKVDFAFFSPLTFITAEKTANAKVLLKKVYGKNEFYYSAILVRSDSKISKLSELKNKVFGFVDKKSTSGYLYPRVMLRSVGLDAGEGLNVGGPVLRSEYFGTHQDTVKALLDKKVDAIGVWADEPASSRGAWTDAPFDSTTAKSLRVISISDPIPNDAFAVREDFYKQNAMAVYSVMEALIGMSAGESTTMKKVFDVDAMATATSRHYDSVRAVDSLLSAKAP